VTPLGGGVKVGDACSNCNIMVMGGVTVIDR
jgi:hypothetical protein